jgi:hypothetical protein
VVSVGKEGFEGWLVLIGVMGENAMRALYARARVVMVEVRCGVIWGESGEKVGVCLGCLRDMETHARMGKKELNRVCTQERSGAKLGGIERNEVVKEILTVGEMGVLKKEGKWSCAE